MSDAVTTQRSTGIARDSYDRVSFNLTLEGRGDTGPKAKERVEAMVKEHLKPVLQGIDQRDIQFDEKDTRASFAVTQEHRYDQQSGRNILAGYLATYSIHLETQQVDRASEIQDRLTCVPQAQVGSPSFTLQPEKRRKLQKTALKEAHAVVMDRFQEECAILDMNADDFEINDWEASYNDQRRQGRTGVENFVAAASMSREASDDCNSPEIEVQSGFAIVEVTLAVGFRRKHNR